MVQEHCHNVQDPEDHEPVHDVHDPEDLGSLDQDKLDKKELYL